MKRMMDRWGMSRAEVLALRSSLVFRVLQVMDMDEPAAPVIDEMSEIPMQVMGS